MADAGPLTCAGCGLLCDDVMIERAGDAVRLAPDCRLGAEWFTRRVRSRADAPATVAGRPADVEAALHRAAELLRGARRPLLHGFAGATVEDARAAVALADRLGALISVDAIDAPWPGAPAVSLRGASTATLGEIRDRSRLVVIWREDPETTHPRLLQRLGFDAGDGARTLAVVDDRDTATTRRADLHLRWPRERDLEAIVALHAPERDGAGLPAELGELRELIDAAGHLAVVHGSGLAAGAGGQRRALALHELVRALSQERHAVTLALPAAAGTRGAEDVLAWQTGYAGAVDLAAGHPELVLATDPLAAAEGVDVAVSIEDDPATLPEGAATIALGALPVRAAAGVTVSIRTAAAGVDAAGTAHRLDGVPLTLQALRAPGDAPTAAAVLTRLLAEVAR